MGFFRDPQSRIPGIGIFYFGLDRKFRNPGDQDLTIPKKSGFFLVPGLLFPGIRDFFNLRIFIPRDSRFI